MLVKVLNFLKITSCDSRLNLSDLRVRDQLLTHINYTSGECFPSISLISKTLSISERMVYKALKKMVNYGYISKQKRISKNGCSYGNLYVLAFGQELSTTLNCETGSLKDTELGVQKDTELGVQNTLSHSSPELYIRTNIKNYTSSPSKLVFGKKESYWNWRASFIIPNHFKNRKPRELEQALIEFLKYHEEETPELDGISLDWNKKFDLYCENRQQWPLRPQTDEEIEAECIDDVKNHIERLPDALREVATKFLANIGFPTYKSWIADTTWEKQGNVVVLIAKTKFHRDQLETKFLSRFPDFLSKTQFKRVEIQYHN